jgi:hypothetical protein
MLRLLPKEEAMDTVNPNKAGLVLGVMLGGWHLLWVLLVAVGWAQPIINFYFRIHFLAPSWTVQGFNAGIAAILILVTSVLGYAGGYILGALWNRLHP